MYTVSLTHQLVAIQDDFDLDKIIESGQCFRPQKLSDGRYRFLSGGALLYLTPLGDGQYDAAWYGSDRESTGPTTLIWAGTMPRCGAAWRDRAAIWTNRSISGRASESCIRTHGKCSSPFSSPSARAFRPSAPPWNTLPGAAANRSVPKAMKSSSSLPAAALRPL